MESLSRAFHRKNLRSFSAYDDVFSGGGGGGFGAPATRIEDYKEIFIGSCSSIPVLDLSALDGAADVAGVRGRPKKLDYSKIFGGLGGDDVANSYEDVFAKRTPTKTTTYSDRSSHPDRQKDEDNQNGKPIKSLEGVKQYNTFYNKTSQISKDGENGTTHVAQIRAVPGFTCFIDENVQKIGDISRSLGKDKIRTTQRVSIELNKQSTTGGTGNLRGQSSCDKFYSADGNVDSNGGSNKIPSFKLSLPTKRSGNLNSKAPKSGAPEVGLDDCSPTFSDEEPNVDSAAAVSAAALRKAVRDAEASIRLAKAIMERSKNGLQRFPKPRSKEGLDMKKKKVEKASIQATKNEAIPPNLKEIGKMGIENEGVRETDGAKSNSSDDGQVHITKLERKKARRSGKVVPGFTQSEDVSGKENVEKLDISVPNASGKVKDDKLENSDDTEALEQFPESVKVQNQRLSNLGFGHANGNHIVPSVSSGSEKTKGDKLELSTDSNVENQKAGEVKEEQLEPSSSSKVVPQFPELVNSENQGTANMELEHTSGNNIMPSFLNLFGKIKEKLELSFDSIGLGQFPEFMKTDNQKTVTSELEHTNDSSFRMPVPNLSDKINEKLETSADSKAQGQFPELVKIDNERTATLELDPTNGSNIRSSVINLSEEVNEKLETSDDSEALGQFPELVKTDDEKIATLDLDHINGNNISVSIPNLSEEVYVKLETSANSEALGQFPELVKIDTLELDHANGNNIRPSVPDLSEEVIEKLETSADYEELGKFPELVKTDNERTATLELDHTNGSNIGLSVPSIPDKVNEKLETSADSEALGQFPELVKTDNEKTATLELDYTNGSNIRESVHNLPEKVNKEKLEISDDSQFSEMLKTDDQRTTISEIEHANGSNISVSTDDLIRISNEGELESSVDMKEPEQIPEFVKTDNLSTTSLELEPTNGSNTGLSVHLISDKVIELEESANTVPDLECTNNRNFSPSVHNVPTEVNENKVEQSADSNALEEFPELVKTDNSSTTTSELGQKSGSNMMPSVHTKGCREMKNQMEGGDVELLERHNKDFHRKRKQWKDIEGKRSDIKIAEEGGQSVHVTIPKEVHEREERTLEPFEGHNKEIYRKRRQWKDVEIKPSDIKIADGEEEYVHGHEKREKETDVLDEKDVDQEKNVSFESSSVQLNHIDKGDEAQKSTQECSKETESKMEGVHEDEESVKRMCKQIESEKIQEYSKWRDSEERRQNVMEREMVNHHAISSASWKEDMSEHLGDISPEGSERMSDASQSSFDYKEDFDFDEEVGEKSEIFQSCEFKANQSIEETIEHEVAITENTYSHHLDDFPEIVCSNDEDAADIARNDSEIAKNMSAGINDLAQSPNVLKEEKKMSGTDDVKENEDNESVLKEVRDDETSKREKERERNRIVVERAIREARERAFAEARERAERAAVEKATAEARERVMAEARQKFEKTTSATKSSTERVSLHAKLKSERAAVERAHAEARERALEKALSQKTNSNTPKQEANTGETAERRNARLVRTQRTMERAAKALAEKNMRDLRAQREQAERHRLAETLDAEIKRWSSGKTGNLRALLSTLQYILGPDSGWQPVSLTEIVTTSAVKKAYRKATLHVHPDKLQQRGASIQQKYICEKVFDLLKAAWNKFNSEER